MQGWLQLTCFSCRWNGLDALHTLVMMPSLRISGPSTVCCTSSTVICFRPSAVIRKPRESPHHKKSASTRDGLQLHFAAAAVVGKSFAMELRMPLLPLAFSL